MESYGLYAAATESQLPQPLAMSIKSVADFANESKEDSYQKYAGYTSAETLRALWSNFSKHSKKANRTLKNARKCSKLPLGQEECRGPPTDFPSRFAITAAKFERFCMLLKGMAPEVGLEPTTLRLTATESVYFPTATDCYKLLPVMHLDPPYLLNIAIHMCPIDLWHGAIFSSASIRPKRSSVDLFEMTDEQRKAHGAEIARCPPFDDSGLGCAEAGC
jgi:hypothetical protein